MLKPEAHFQLSGAPKMTPSMNFRYAIMLWQTSQMHHTPAQFVGHGRLLNVFFGSSQTDYGCRDMAMSSLGALRRSRTKFTRGLLVVYMPG